MQRRGVVVVLAVAAIAIAGCSSSGGGSSQKAGGTSGSAGAAASGAPTKTVTVGLLEDLTGPAAVTGGTTEQGIKAGVKLAATEGYNIKYVTADTTSSPTGALTAAKKLVQQDHVFAVLMISQLGFAAAPYLTSQNIPVVGANVDGKEWLTSKNMFSVYGYGDYSKANPTYGTLFKKLGGKVFGGVAYGIVPASSQVVAGTAKSALAAGLKVGYTNVNLVYGTTDVGPIALGMKSSHVDVVYPGVTQQTSFSLVKTLRDQGVTFKAFLPTGYGGDLVTGGADAKSIAQGVYFLTGFEPVEMNTPATKEFVKYLQLGAGTQTPTLSNYLGYLSIDALVEGLQKSGANPTQAQFINTMLGITNYAARGLFAGHTLSFALASRGTVAGADNCLFVSQYSGTTFHPITGLIPVCGETLSK